METQGRYSVTLLLGRDRLLTKPVATGSPPRLLIATLNSVGHPLTKVAGHNFLSLLLFVALVNVNPFPASSGERNKLNVSLPIS